MFPFFMYTSVTHLPDETAGCDGCGCQAVPFPSRAVGEDVPALQRTADQLVWVKGKISNRNTFIIAARFLQKIITTKQYLVNNHCATQKQRNMTTLVARWCGGEQQGSWFDPLTPFCDLQTYFEMIIITLYWRVVFHIHVFYNVTLIQMCSFSSLSHFLPLPAPRPWRTSPSVPPSGPAVLRFITARREFHFDPNSAFSESCNVAFSPDCQ